MRYWYDEEHDMKMCEPDCVDEWLFDIWAIGCDYDGCYSAEELKQLIDELVGMSGKARDCLWDGQLFGIHGMPKPKTNADRIRAMSDEELAEWLDNGDFGCNDCPEAERLSAQPSLRGEVCDGACKRHFLEWLKRPVKDGEDDVR